MGQNYTRDAGLRMGEGVFFSYRQFYDEESAVEAMVGFSKNGFRIIGLREYVIPLMNIRSENLKFIYGYGVHAGVNYTNHYKLFFKTYYHDWRWSPQFGIDGLAGFEYTFPEFPALIRLGIQPYFEYSINRYFQLNAFNLVMSINYRF